VVQKKVSLIAVGYFQKKVRNNFSSSIGSGTTVVYYFQKKVRNNYIMLKNPLLNVVYYFQKKVRNNTIIYKLLITFILERKLDFKNEDFWTQLD